MPQRFGGRLVFGSALLLVLSVVALVAAAMKQYATRGDERETAKVNRPARVAGTDVVGVFIVSSECGFSEIKELPAALDAIRRRLGDSARRSGKRFYLVGISLDDDPLVGVAFLKRFGFFNELMAGGGWLGTGSLHFMVRDIPGPVGMPQFILLERQSEIGEVVKASADRVVLRRVGANEIIRYAHDSIDASVTVGK